MRHYRNKRDGSVVSYGEGVYDTPDPKQYEEVEVRAKEALTPGAILGRAVGYTIGGLAVLAVVGCLAGLVRAIWKAVLSL